MTTSKDTFQQMSKPTRTVVRILEDNWTRISRSCNYKDGNICSLNDKRCNFECCELLKKENNEEAEINGSS
ncbi:hypothetical protein AKJ65_01555 [candidate division MSBL1 archaeon SCGC-AAA259E19]|uniref:Uncharacterized protein n=1 Tax=candidate division MSBL1 archaeon SCGC-AAA259E19 TaxID=1698264 RepID=A0A133UMW7_9EURY|nr:hypothetical protein AKJ65_01555 [candidate division MSBL1 archaeon SCGC-AAA259E19]